MTKKAILLALAAVSAAILAVPDPSSAQTAHIDQTSTFTVTGGQWSLGETNGVTFGFPEIAGSGTFTTATTGTLNLVFDGVTEPIFGFRCYGVPADNPGRVTSTNLTFHLIMLATNKPGILITPSADGAFVHIKCPTYERTLTGTGIIGTITAPSCGVSSTTLTLKIRKLSTGHQEHKIYTGVSYDLHTDGAGSPTASMDVPGDIVLHFPTARKIECTHTT
jgi:hypothetical protein